MKKKLNIIFLLFIIFLLASFTFSEAYAELRSSNGMRRVSLSGPGTMSATRDSKEITHEEVEEILRQYIAKQAGQSGVKAELKSIQYSGRILLPYARNIEYDVVPSISSLRFNRTAGFSKRSRSRRKPI